MNGATYSYRAESADLLQWEIGTGVYNSGTGVLTRAVVLFNSSGTTSKINFSTAPQVAIVALAEDIARPVHTRTVITTAGSGTYNTPSGCKAILVKLQGAGAGGGGSGATAGNGGNGTSTTFNAGAITAPGGTGSTGGSGSGGAGGVAGTGGDFSIPGGRGQNSNNSIALGDSGNGGSSFFGGAGTGAMPNGAVAASAAATNSGAGGGGGGSASGVGAVGGGGGGAYTEKLIAGPASSYSYVVGTKGAAGTAGTSGSAGSAGGDGIIIVEEYY
ncbi:hypothetical protein [Bradyrhizobium guangdongense]|uniref:hypothetical protein n=1 Tax=Bradyrhizobium guangdongense TaxID=1325090 RepID=UPI001FDA58AC|nr:hypothetical protein [Bradyrhizobium guangdongense]